MYQASATMPVARVSEKEFDEFTRHLLRRFQPFVWMCVWTILITGVALMLFNPRFVWFQFNNRWSALLGLKQLVFVVMIFFSFGYARMFDSIEKILARNGAKEQVMPFYNQMLLFGKVNVALAILALLLAAGLHS